MALSGNSGLIEVVVESQHQTVQFGNMGATGNRYYIIYRPRMWRSGNSSSMSPAAASATCTGQWLDLDAQRCGSVV
jgi:hypothetical protein